MYLSDYHTHCSLSFDSKTPVEDMVRAGIAQGLQEMCLTDHVDLFRPRETAHWEHDFSNREETFARADQAADGKIIVRRGIELGEAMRDFAYADELLSRLPELDFVIGSQHQLSEKYDWNDLYFMPEATEQEARADRGLFNARSGDGQVGKVLCARPPDAAASLHERKPRHAHEFRRF